MQLFNWCEGFAGRRVIPEEVGVPAAARGAAAGAARGHCQGGGHQLVVQLEQRRHNHPYMGRIPQDRNLAKMWDVFA